MRKVVNLLVRKPDLSHEAFREYWYEEHAPLAEDLPGVWEYATSVPTDPEKAAYDGIAELYLESGAGLGDVFGTPAGERIQADMANFLDEAACDLLVVDETVQFSRAGE